MMGWRADDFSNLYQFPCSSFPSIAMTEGVGWHHRQVMWDWIGRSSSTKRSARIRVLSCISSSSKVKPPRVLFFTVVQPTTQICWGVRQHLPQQQPGSFCCGVTLLWWSQEQDLSLGPTSQGQNCTCSPLAGVVFSVYSGRCFTGAGTVSVCPSEALVLLF